MASRVTSSPVDWIGNQSISTYPIRCLNIESLVEVELGRLVVSARSAECCCWRAPWMKFEADLVLDEAALFPWLLWSWLEAEWWLIRLTFVDIWRCFEMRLELNFDWWRWNGHKELLKCFGFFVVFALLLVSLFVYLFTLSRLVEETWGRLRDLGAPIKVRLKTYQWFSPNRSDSALELFSCYFFFSFIYYHRQITFVVVFVTEESSGSGLFKLWFEFDLFSGGEFCILSSSHSRVSLLSGFILNHLFWSLWMWLSFLLEGFSITIHYKLMIQVDVNSDLVS